MTRSLSLRGWCSTSLLLPALLAGPWVSSLQLCPWDCGSFCGVRAFGHRGCVPLPREGCAHGALADPHLLPLSPLLPSGSLVHAAVTQPPSVSANLRQTVWTMCSGNSNQYGWFQQKTRGSAPVTVIYYNSKKPSDISA